MPQLNSPYAPWQHYLTGGGEMGELIRKYNWAGTAIGSPDTWSQSLLTTVSIILNSRFPMFLWWGPHLVQFYNDAYRPSLGNQGKHPKALGQRGEECWPEIWPVIKPLIDQVILTGESTWSEDQLIPIYRNNQLEDVYWTFSYSPVIDESALPAGVLVICNETTDKVNAYNRLKEAKQEIEQAQRETEIQRDALNRFFMQAPAGICVLDGPDMVYELVNPTYQQLFPGRKLLGKPLFEALPELKGQAIEDILKGVYQTAMPYEGREVLIPVANYEGGPLEERYFNFTYQARLDENRNVDGILVFVFEVTEMAVARRLVEESEKRFRNMLEQAPVPLLVTRGENLVFDMLNQPMIDLIGKGDTIIGKPWYEAIPELEGQPIIERLYHVYHTGEQWTGYEQPVMVEQNGESKLHYYNIACKPLIENGKIAGVLQSAVEVTAQVNARADLEKIKDTLKLALSAAELGTFDMDLEKGTMYWDERCRTLFGISHNNTVTYEKDFITGLYAADRDRIIGIINNNVFIKAVSNGDYDVEYRTVGAEDQKLRWVRAKGKAYFNDDDKPVRFTGAVLDITEQKLDELRKNDFIGMVSHELKTPLTSLTALVQMLHAKMEKTGDSFATEVLYKANMQVKKMSAMINSFLNVSRLESGKIHLNKEDFNLDELIKDMIDEAGLTMPSHVIKLQPCNPVLIFADKEKISSVISNLLSNAVKYSPREMTIDVKYEAKDNIAKVSVTDKGMGIKPADLERIFERYYRVESNHRQNISGFGIGLYLSAEIIQRHGGEIGAVSEPAKGSTFWFTLPLAIA